MIKITKPVLCSHCGKMMNDYVLNKNTGRIVFTCMCGKGVDLSEEEYIALIRKRFTKQI